MASIIWTVLNQVRNIPVSPDHFDGSLRLAAVNGIPSITIAVTHESDNDSDFLIAVAVKQAEDPDFVLSLDLDSNMTFLGAKYQNHPVTEEFACRAIAALQLDLSSFQWECLVSDRVCQAETAETV